MDQFDLTSGQAFLLVSGVLGVAITDYWLDDRSEVINLGDDWWRRLRVIGKTAVAAQIITALWAAYLHGFAIIPIMFLIACMAGGASLFTVQLRPVVAIIAGLVGIAGAASLIAATISAEQKQEILAKRQLLTDIRQECASFIGFSSVFKNVAERCIANHMALHEGGRPSLATQTASEYFAAYELPAHGGSSLNDISAGERAAFIKYLREDGCKNLEDVANAAYLAKAEGVPISEHSRELSWIYGSSPRGLVVGVLVYNAYHGAWPPSELRSLSRYWCLALLGAGIGTSASAYEEIWHNGSQWTGQ